MSRTIIRPLSTHDCGQNRGQENIHLTAIVTAITKSAHLHMAHIFSHTRVQRASFRDKAPLSRIQRDRIITAERGIWQQRQGTELPRNCTCCQITRKPRRVIPVRGCSSIRCPGGTRTHTVQILRLSPLPIGIQGLSHNLIILTRKKDFAKSLSGRRFAPYSTP